MKFSMDGETIRKAVVAVSGLAIVGSVATIFSAGSDIVRGLRERDMILWERLNLTREELADLESRIDRLEKTTVRKVVSRTKPQNKPTDTQ